MLKFLVWIVLFIVAWPLALVALVLYPIVWLISIPFRIIGFSVDALLDLIRGILGLPGRVLRGPGGANAR